MSGSLQHNSFPSWSECDGVQCHAVESSAVSERLFREYKRAGGFHYSNSRISYFGRSRGLRFSYLLLYSNTNLLFWFNWMTKQMPIRAIIIVCWTTSAAARSISRRRPATSFVTDSFQSGGTASQFRTGMLLLLRAAVNVRLFFPLWNKRCFDASDPPF